MALIFFALFPLAGKAFALDYPKIEKGDRIVLVGAGMGSRMAKFGHFETELFLRFADRDITIRNMCDEGNTPGFRPHPGRTYEDQFAFPGAKELVNPLYWKDTNPQGHFDNPDQWLTRLGADILIAFFGYNSSFEGPKGLSRFRAELQGFLEHTLKQNYNGSSPPQVVLVSPTAYQKLNGSFDLPDGIRINQNLALYTQAMREVASALNVLFVDAFNASRKWYRDNRPYTTDGNLLNDAGYRKLGAFLADSIFGKMNANEALRIQVLEAVKEKNWAWLNNFKIPNGVHVYGRRYRPYGPLNYPHELKKTEEMTEIRDRAIWALLAGKAFDIAVEDAKTHPLPPIETNYQISSKTGTIDYLTGEASEKRITTADGYQMKLFASEEMFPDLANPSQISFDNKGRLWVSTMPSYPHYRIGDPLPKDKLIIFEDTDSDGKADKQTVFADDLHLPIGFEIAPEGVYVSQSDSLVLLTDSDGDDKYDGKEYILSGFDDHDTHHGISAFCADPSGAIVMGEGLFLHSNIETAYGPVRGSNGGFFRYDPKRRKLTRHSQFRIPNPWGTAFDEYGQCFFLITSGTKLSWMLPGTVKPIYGYNMVTPNILTSNLVRPTSGLEIVSSSHFPDDVQGDLLFNNTIGFLGAKQHQLIEEGSGFTTKFRHDLFASADRNFRPVDLEFAPDGSLYVADWHNVLIGHMQHNARDPLRDHVHGRIYRVTYPSRPLITPVKVFGASVAELIENLKHPQYRTRYRIRRELRGRDAAEVLPPLQRWAAQQTDDRLKLEALWVSWGLNEIDQDLLRELLASSDHRIRSAAVTAVKHNRHVVADAELLLKSAANDIHGRVRFEAMAAASWLPTEIGLPIVETVRDHGFDNTVFAVSYEFAKAGLEGKPIAKRFLEENVVNAPKSFDPVLESSYRLGHEVYFRDGHCATCHQADGNGIKEAGFPPLSQTDWVNGDTDTLIAITLKGMAGPLVVNGETYPGHVPMTGFESLLSDREIAAVLTFIRNSFGNNSEPIVINEVKAVREKFKTVRGPLNAADLTQ